MEDLFTVHQFKIHYEHIGQKIPLYPFGDVHWGSHNCAETLFDNFCESCKKNQGYYLGTGDYIDLLSWSERRAISQSGLHDTTLKTLDDLLLKRIALKRSSGSWKMSRQRTSNETR